jgi:hypothetical protein
MVSVLVSVADHSAQNSLLHTELELEAEVGIEQKQEDFPKPTNPQLPPHHQRRTAS